MNFQNEMKQMFLKVAAGETEPAEWENWWNCHKSRLEEILNRAKEHWNYFMNIRLRPGSSGKNI